MSHDIDDLLEKIEILKGYKHMHQKLNEQNKRYREYFNKILTNEYGYEGLEAERELERITDIAIDALEQSE